MDSSFPHDPYTETLESLLLIDEYWHPGIVNVLLFMVGEQGIVIDDTIDMTLMFTDVVNWGGWSYDFDQTGTVLMMCSEFCLLNTVYSRQNLHMVELQDNTVFFLINQREFDAALEAATLCAFQKASIFHNITTRASLCLFGEWDEAAGDILSSILTRGRLCSSVSSLRHHLEVLGGNTHPSVFVDRLRKLREVGLIRVHVGDEPIIEIVSESAGLFLMLSNRTDLVKMLADLSS